MNQHVNLRTAGKKGKREGRKLSRLLNRYMSLAIIFALVISLLPAGLNQASAASEYFQIADFSPRVETPSEVNTESVDVSGTYNGVSFDSITYEADTILYNGTTVEVISSRKGTDVKPEKVGDKGFRFTRLKLEQGLNRITIKGSNALGNVVEEPVYIRYGNAPMLYDIKAADGRFLRDNTDPTVIDSKSITLSAANAKEVYVNGKKMYSGDGKNYVASDLPLEHGRNTLVISASNGTKTITETRDVIYFAGVPTAYDTLIGGTKIERGGIVNNPTGSITGAVVFRLDSTVQDQLNNLKLTLTNPAKTETEVTGNVVNVTKDGRFIVFHYNTGASTVNVTDQGAYKLLVKGDYGKAAANYAIDFTNRTSVTPYITEVRQLFNVIDNGTNVSYDKSAPLSPNSTFLGMPVYLLVKTSAATSVSLQSLLNGAPTSNFAFETRQPADGTVGTVLKITSMVPGQQNLVFTPGGSTSDQVTIPVSYVSAPFLEILNIPDGKIFNKVDDFREIVVRYTNFSASELSNVTLSINGTKKPLTGDNSTTNRTVTYQTTADDKKLIVAGPNKITVSGTTNGIPVTTTITVYIFSKFAPEVSSMVPVPFVVDAAGSRIPQLNDPNGLFKKVGDFRYSTSEKAVEVLFSTSNADKLEVKVDGKVHTSATLDNGGWSINPAVIELVSATDVVDENGQPVLDDEGKKVTRYTFRLVKQPNDTKDALTLSKTGEKSIMVTVRKGSSNVSQTLTIVRENASFIVRSPKLPDESVINQNYLKVSIEAEGADKVLIGKQELKKDAVHDLFRGEVDKLKVGKNTIKFTVIQGNQKINGQFTVTYAGEKLPGALFKTNIATSGKVSLFKGDLNLTLPKGTLLRESNPLPGQAPPEINMFDNQKILFGIADRNDGRILKKYNAVGEEISGRPQDGVMKEIPADLSAAQYLSMPGRYGYASELFWMDAGYIKKDSAGNVIEVIEGKLPYKSQNNPGVEPTFYERSNNQWMEPTQRGTIKIKYDPNIRDAISSNLAIWRWIDRDQRWVNLGGTIDAKGKTITAPFSGFGYYAVLGVKYSFDDIIGHPYARNSLELALASDIMKPVDNNEFGVYNNTSRGEFATMLVKILDIPLEYDESKPTFDDVQPYGAINQLWEFKYVETAVRKGIIRGIGPRFFDPNGDLTRQQAAAMIARALNLKLNTPEKDLPKLQKLFTDANTINHYMITAVMAVNKAGYISGIANQQLPGQKKPTYRFDPDSNLKRADAAVIAERLLRKMKKIK